MPTTAIIAGGGDLPKLILSGYSSDHLILINLDGHADGDLADLANDLNIPNYTYRLGQVGKILSAMADHNVTTAVLAGSVDRPSIHDLRPDTMGAKLLAKAGLKRAFRGGDDALLSVVRDILADHGIDLIRPDKLLDDLLSPSGVFGRISPTDDHRSSIQSALAVAKQIGRMDIGQAVVVQNGIILGVEGVEGTDQLIRRCGELKKSGGHGPILVKAKKPQQDDRLDLPTVGPKTIKNMAEAGFDGMAVEAGGTHALHRDKMIDLADKAGIFIIGVSPQANDYD
jgi:hypothetical protein